MPTTIEEVIANIEAQLAEAVGLIDSHEYHIGELRKTVSLHEHTLALLRSALPPALDEAPAPAPEPAKEVAAPRPLPAAVGANGFDRAAIRRQLREWHIRYPVARSYRIPSQMMRQAQRAAIMDHPGYRGDWIANGGVDLGDSHVSHTTKDIEDAAEMLGIDYEAIGNAAHKAQRLLALFGTPGVDHHNWDEAR